MACLYLSVMRRSFSPSRTYPIKMCCSFAWCSIRVIRQSAAIFFNAICGLVYFKEFPSTERSFQGHITSSTYFVGLAVTCLSVAGLIFRHKDADLENFRIIAEDVGKKCSLYIWVFMT